MSLDLNLHPRANLNLHPVLTLTAAVDTLTEIGAAAVVVQTSTSAEHSSSGRGVPPRPTSTSLTSTSMDVDVSLNPLGYHLASLPLDVRLGKALIFGALLRCADPVLTIAAALSDRSPWR